jgi:DNA-binding MarR family transcriptional regulator
MTAFAVAMRIRRLAMVLNDRLDDLASRQGLSVYGDYEVLATIRRADRPLQPSVVADALNLTRAGVTGRLDRLEALGLIRRKNSDADARSVLVSLSPAGSECVDRVFAAATAERVRLFGALDESERRQLADLLKRVLLDVGDVPNVESG